MYAQSLQVATDLLYYPFCVRPLTWNNMGKEDNPDVVIWTNRGCPACVRAKSFFDSKKINYNEKKLSSSPSIQRAFSIATKGAKSIPQIFINGEHIGGFDDLVDLDLEGGLDNNE